MQSFSYSFRLNGSSVDHFTIKWLISCVFFLLCYQSLLLLLFNHFNLDWLRLKSLIPRVRVSLEEPRSSLRLLCYFLGGLVPHVFLQLFHPCVS